MRTGLLSGVHHVKTSPLALVAASLIGISGMIGHGEEPKEDLKSLIKKKLESSQKVLESLAINDFDTVGNHARELIRISKAAEFRVVKTPQYELHSKQLRWSAEMLEEMAKAKNGDGAALAYVELTLTCLKCHRHVREIGLERK